VLCTHDTGRLVRDMTEHINCKKCDTSIHWLDEFPNRLCINCHAERVDAMTPEEMKQHIDTAFGNGGIIQKDA
jgi:hypothetical protein